MLYSIDTCKYVTKLPHNKDYDKWRKNISDLEYEKIVDVINQEIDGNDVNTAGWIPGHNWTGTVYEAIDTACGGNEIQSGWFFGLIVFKTLMERHDHVWGFGKFESKGIPIKSMTYFIIKNPPKRK